MNVQVHRAVSDLTGEGDRDAHRAGDHGWRARSAQAGRAAAHALPQERGGVRGVPDRHVVGRAPVQPAGSAAAVPHQASIADYERQLLEELAALWPEERREEPVSPHPIPKKEQAMRSKGQLDEREALRRATGGDLTRIDGIGAGRHAQ